MPKTYITPTYQSNLNSAIRDVVVRLNFGDVFGAWQALRTLYHLSPPKVTDECKEEYEEINQKLLNHCGGHSIDPTMRNARHTAKARSYLSYANLTFLAHLKDSLHKHDYLEQRRGAIPFNPRSQHITSDHE